MLPEGKMHHSTVGITIVPNSFNPYPEADFKAITVQQFQMARRSPCWKRKSFWHSKPRVHRYTVATHFQSWSWWFTFWLNPCKMNQCWTCGNLQTPHQGCSRQSPVALSKHRSMSTCDAGGYVEPHRCSDLIDLSVQCLNGEGCRLQLSGSCTGWEVYRMVSKQLPQKKGARLNLHHLDLTLLLHEELQTQGIIGKAATLSCTFVPTDLYAAWCTVRGLPVSQEELALEGVTRIQGSNSRDYLHHLPESLEHLTFGEAFNQSLEGVNMPRSLQTLSFGHRFNQGLEGVTLPSSLQTLTFGDGFNQGLEGVTLPSSLQTLTFGRNFGREFNQRLEGVTLPSSLQTLTFGYWFNQSLEGVTLPSNLQTLTFGDGFNQSLEEVTLPSSLQTLTFGYCFNQSLERVTLPSSLQTLTFGDDPGLTRVWKELPCQVVFRAWHVAAIAMVVTEAWKKWRCQAVFRPWPLEARLARDTRAWKEWPCQAVFRPWHLAITLTRAWKEWPCQAVFRPWPLEASLTRAWKKWPCQAVFRPWHLAIALTRAWKELPCQAVFRPWPLEASLTRAWKKWPCQAVFRLWHLAIALTRAWNEWPCQAVFRPWHLAMGLTRASNEWPCQAVFRPWHLAMVFSRAWKEWPSQAVSKALANVRSWWASRDLLLKIWIIWIVHIYFDILRIMLFELRSTKQEMNWGQKVRWIGGCLAHSGFLKLEQQCAHTDAHLWPRDL